MFKLILLTLALGISQFASAQSSSNTCVTDLMYSFHATATEAQQICAINSSAVFLKCMEHKSTTTQLDVHSAAVACDSKFKNVQQNSTLQYVNSNTCEVRLQVGARMRPRRSIDICKWDSSEVMLSCLIQIVQKAQWHSEHALQYCDFANQNYRRHIPQFVQCVTTHPLRSKNIEKTAQSCHESILDIIIPGSKQKPVVVEVVTSVEVTPAVVEVAPIAVVQEEQNKKVVTETVPTPIKININVQESAKAEAIVEQPVQVGSTTNSEVLPLD